MSVKIAKVNGYRVTHGGKVSAKRTTKKKAQGQANLLQGVAHGWKPSAQAKEPESYNRRLTKHLFGKD